MTYSKLVSKNNVILFFFSILPISFICGNAVLELNIFFIIIFFLRELLLNKDYLSRILKTKFFYLLISLWFYLRVNSRFNFINSFSNHFRDYWHISVKFAFKRCSN